MAEVERAETASWRPGWRDRKPAEPGSCRTAAYGHREPCFVSRYVRDRSSSARNNALRTLSRAAAKAGDKLSRSAVRPRCAPLGAVYNSLFDRENRRVSLRITSPGRKSSGSIDAVMAARKMIRDSRKSGRDRHRSVCGRAQRSRLSNGEAKHAEITITNPGFIVAVGSCVAGDHLGSEAQS